VSMGFLDRFVNTQITSLHISSTAFSIKIKGPGWLND
jgi:hypothetical protein